MLQFQVIRIELVNGIACGNHNPIQVNFHHLGSINLSKISSDNYFY